MNSVQSNMSKDNSLFYEMAYYNGTQGNFKHCIENLLLFQFALLYSSSSLVGKIFELFLKKFDVRNKPYCTAFVVP